MHWCSWRPRLATQRDPLPSTSPPLHTSTVHSTPDRPGPPFAIQVSTEHSSPLAGRTARAFRRPRRPRRPPSAGCVASLSTRTRRPRRVGLDADTGLTDRRRPRLTPAAETQPSIPSRTPIDSILVVGPDRQGRHSPHLRPRVTVTVTVTWSGLRG